MDVKEAYRYWSLQYDTNVNPSRDLESISLRNLLSDGHFYNCLEIGCGSGKNTEWLVKRCKCILAVDISDEMLTIARAKVTDTNVTFINADVQEPWNKILEISSTFDLVVCSLVLEHIEDIAAIINRIAEHLDVGGVLYIGEVHPFKQYSGSKARFITDKGEQIVEAFTHHISDFTDAAKKNGLKIEEIKEYFDDDDRSNIPRILALKFIK